MVRRACQPACGLRLKCRGGGIVRRDVVDFERMAVSESRPSAIDVLLHEGAGSVSATAISVVTSQVALRR